MPLSRRQLDRFLQRGHLVLDMGEGVLPVTRRYNIRRSRADGLCYDGTSIRFAVVAPDLIPVGVLPLHGPAWFVDDLHKSFGPDACLFVPAPGPAIRLWEVPGGWEVMIGLAVGKPTPIAGRFADADAAVEFVLSLLSGPTDDPPAG